VGGGPVAPTDDGPIGQDALKKDGEKILLQVAEVIRSDTSLRDRLFQVAGHTDDQPLKRSAETFHDNWGLSLMRARQVLVFLVASPDGDAKVAAKPPGPKAKDAKDAKKPAVARKAEVASGDDGGGLSPKRWSASGYGQTDPIANNDTPEGRAKNRRVELILMPDVEEMLDLKSLL
jgi:chemotaxis protein MotB